MLIFLYGPDTYRAKEKLKEIIEKYKKIHKSGLNLNTLDLKERSFQDFDEKIRSASMFKEKKLIILKNAFSNLDFKTNFLKNKKNYLNTQETIVFYEQTIPKGNDSLFRFLKEKGRAQEFKELSGQKLKNWVDKELEKYGAKRETGILEKLIEFVGSDLWRLSNEIKKLVSFSQNKKINLKDIELLVKPKIETDIFKTIDAIAEKNKKRALSLVHKHLEKGDSPLYLLTMINFQFRNLLMIKTRQQHTNGATMAGINNLSKELGIHPYAVRKASWLAGRFNLEELKKIYQKIFQADLNIKTGKIGPEIALDLLIAAI